MSTEKPGVLQFMGSQKVGQVLAAEQQQQYSPTILLSASLGRICIPQGESASLGKSCIPQGESASLGRICITGESASLRENEGPASRLPCCFLAALSLFLHPPASLISNGLNLPFVTQGRSRRLQAISSEIRNVGQRMASMSRSPTMSCSVSV